MLCTHYQKVNKERGTKTMITPNDFKNSDEKRINVLIEKIDESMLSNHGHYDYEFAHIYEEPSFELRDSVAKKYKEAGWKYVYHRTSSENGERPGITSFIFSERELEYCIIKGYHTV